MDRIFVVSLALQDRAGKNSFQTYKVSAEKAGQASKSATETAEGRGWTVRDVVAVRPQTGKGARGGGGAKGQAPGMLLTMTHLSHYRISDRSAGVLARDAGKPLPKPGRSLRVELPDGRMADLLRTPLRYSKDAPKRGWVWCVMP